jgi:hypothetical protein
VKYLILIYSNPRSREIWNGFSAERKAEGLAHYAAFTRELAESGALVTSAALADPAGTRPVPPRALPTDGPFAETKEHLAGFLLLECDSMEHALEHAARVPEAGFGLVEVRPVRDLDNLASW